MYMLRIRVRCVRFVERQSIFNFFKKTHNFKAFHFFFLMLFVLLIFVDILDFERLADDISLYFKLLGYACVNHCFLVVCVCIFLVKM